MSSHVKGDGARVRLIGAGDALAAVVHRYAALPADLPAHARLAEALRQTIDAGELRPGDPLPGDAALVAAIGLARGTVRQAVGALRTEGLVQTRQGARTSVLARPRLQPFSELVSFSTWARRIGATPGAQIVELVRRPADERAASTLQLEPNQQAWTLLRVRTLDGAPTLVEHATYPDAIGRLLVDADLEHGSVYATLAEHGVIVASGHHRISAIAASRSTALLLNCPAGAPLLRQERTVYASDGAPIEHSDDHWRGDAIVLDAANSTQGSLLSRHTS